MHTKAHSILTEWANIQIRMACYYYFTTLKISGKNREIKASPNKKQRQLCHLDAATQ